MSFAWSWLAILLPLVWLFFRRSNAGASGALDHPYLMALGVQSEQTQQDSLLQRSAASLVWLLLILALMRPQWVGPILDNPVSGRSLYLSVDLSESMLERDMRWNGQSIERYQAVQAVVSEFVNKRQGDFLGLVVFGSFAEIQAPLTADTTAVAQMLFDLRPGMAGNSTAIGDGLALAVKQLRESDAHDKVVILLSDGANNSGNVTPEQAMDVAAQSEIKVYTIGFGSQGNGSLFNLMRGGAQIDEATLTAIAEQTGGQYFRAGSTDDLVTVFDQIDQLERTERTDQPLRRVTELYWWPATAALLLLVSINLIPFLPFGRKA